MTTDRAAMQQAEIAIANLLSYQSTGNTPTIHEYGHARRTLGAMRQALAHPVPDVAAVMKHAAWLGSEDYSALEAAITALEQGRDDFKLQRDMSIIRMREQDLRIAELEQGQDALDAKRYRWIRAHASAKRYGVTSGPEFVWPQIQRTPEQDLMRGSVAQHLDTSIDAAMATQPAPTSGKLEPVVPAYSKMIAAPAVVAGLSVAVCPNCCDTGTEHGVYASYPCMFCKKLAATKGAQP